MAIIFEVDGPQTEKWPLKGNGAKRGPNFGKDKKLVNNL